MLYFGGFFQAGRIRKRKVSLGFLAACLAAVSLVMTGCSTVRQPSSGRSSSGIFSGTSSGKASSGLPRAGSGRGGYYQNDGPMEYTPEDLENTPDAIPRVEPYARGPNKPYTVFGKTYVPITDNRPYKVRGMGSWYGKKFHGNKTSSGEIYDMFKMTAAHPTLPIPCYARVTNISTGRQVIVRVNDRGPFHSDRIIDLSYTAALKLDYLQKGSAMLEVEHLLPDEIERINLARAQNPAAAPVQQTASSSQQTAPASSGTAAAAVAAAATAVANAGNPSKAVAYYLQLGAYQQIGNARATQAAYALNWAHLLPGVEVVTAADSYYRLFAGPFSSQEEADYAAQQIGMTGNRPLVVKR